MFSTEFSNKVMEVKRKLMFGNITYEQAKAELEPILNEANRKGREIAAKYSKRYNPLSFISLMR